MNHEVRGSVKERNRPTDVPQVVTHAAQPHQEMVESAHLLFALSATQLPQANLHLLKPMFELLAVIALEIPCV